MEQLLAALRAAGERTRLRLIALLSANELAVNEIGRVLGQSQPRVSRHLKLLCEAGLLERFQEGAYVFYRLAERSANAELAQIVASLIPDDDPELARDRERLETISRERAAEAERYFNTMADRWDDFRRLHVEESAVEEAVIAAAGEPPIGEFLDLGTGTGRMLEVFADRVERGLGLDLSHQMLTVARANLEKKGLRNCRVRRGDVYNVDLPSASVDVVSVHHVLHFLDRPGEAIREAARVLRPGGRMVIVDFGPHEMEVLRAEHAHRRLGFTDAEIENWLTQAGLEAEPPVQLNPADTSADTSADRPLVTSVWAARQKSNPPAVFPMERLQ